MHLDSIVSERLSQLSLFSPEPHAVEESVEEFVAAWRELGRELLQKQLQAQLEAAEAPYRGCWQRRWKRYHTPLGTVTLNRRIYGDRAAACHGEQVLGLPADGWFRQVKELGCALGVGSEFANANRLLTRWSGVQVSEKTLANHVEATGAQLRGVEGHPPAEPVCSVRTSVSTAVVPPPQRPVFYIGADGIHTPMHGGGTCEAKELRKNNLNYSDY
ncbi:MAG: hypothetical protein ACFBSF_10935 [Leptolyngbyaceae cyanobacterium]